jgi:3-hydroxybutyryl-CoA dehydrogenase
MNEAARLMEEGVATAEDIDKAVKYGFGFRFAVLGLLEFIDWGGGDILYYASLYLSGAMDDERFAAPKIINANMAEGRNGLRDGKGFYDYAAVDVPAYRRERLAAFFRMLQQAGLAMPPASDAPSTAPSD